MHALMHEHVGHQTSLHQERKESGFDSDDRR